MLSDFLLKRHEKFGLTLTQCRGFIHNPVFAVFLGRNPELFGKNAVTPLFFAPVPIFASELADPEKGTGILMVCTFGDATDVLWWREQGLEMRQVLGRAGRLR